MAQEDFVGELTRFCRDCEYQGSTHPDLKHAVEMTESEVDETYKGVQTGNVPEIVDGFGDVAFLALNGIYKTFRKLGDDHDIATTKVAMVMGRICRANNGKRQADGTVLRNEAGKVQKPEGWRAPQYDDLIVGRNV